MTISLCSHKGKDSEFYRFILFVSERLYIAKSADYSVIYCYYQKIINPNASISLGGYPLDRTGLTIYYCSPGGPNGYPPRLIEAV